jgi:hypothetical protein
MSVDLTLPSKEVQIKAGAYPCLLYHRTDVLEQRAKIPEHMSCPVNMRMVDITRLGHNNLSTQKNLVYLLREENLATNPSTMLSAGGAYHVVFTSYDETNSSTPVAMHSTTSSLETETISACATHLTLEIITNAIKWFVGTETSIQREYTSVAEALTDYLTTLNNVIPLNKQSGGLVGLQETLTFIENHVWSDDCREDLDFVCGELRDYIEWSRNNSKDDMTQIVFLSCLARRFLYKHVAKQTKIVMHVVDGIHRLTTIECLD